MILKPRLMSSRAKFAAYFLCASARVKKTSPLVGSELLAAIWLLAKLFAKSLDMPITSPVLFISGPRIRSAPESLLNGNTASLTQT